MVSYLILFTKNNFILLMLTGQDNSVLKNVLAINNKNLKLTHLKVHTALNLCSLLHIKE